ncbi:YfhO family protein [Butyrivibrio sp. WCD2001]|uniref:YfhO family protein n=1 Tax=Butyrivibrio sp. WCD2001 TaxID=1280681 RepID=UPI0003FE81B7|nr:YfhO family protein [Butyrivibrio sp. WCD2001]
MKNTAGHSKKAVFFSFTILYIITALLVWGWFYYSKKSMINATDAFEQHINALSKYGRFLRGVAHRIFSEHKFDIQSYDLGIGYGADFLTSMQYYAVGDPLNLPMAFLPSKYVYYYFQFLILLRPYLAGLSFLLLVSGKERFTLVSKLTGAISYSFCGIVMFIGMWNPQFVQPMICLPLLVYGVRTFISKRKSLPFILAVVLSAVSNFYFFYMLVLMTLVYGLIYIFTSDEVKTLSVKFQLIGRFMCMGIIGTLISMPILLPVILAFLSNPRAGLGSHGVPLIYKAEYYKELIGSLIAYRYFPSYDTVIGFTFIALPALVFLIFKREEDEKGTLLRQRILAVLMTLMLLFPVAGYVMTGFSYTINRWSFAYCLLLSYLATELTENGDKLSMVKQIILGVICILYSAAVLIFGDTSKLIYPQLVFLGVFWIIILIKKIPASVRRAAILLLVFLAVVQNGYAANAPQAGNLPSGYVDKMSPEEYDELVMNTELRALTETVPEGYEQYYSYTGRNLTFNASLPYSIPSTQFYWSLANGSVSDFLQSMAINEMANFQFFGLDDRAIPLTLSGVKYYSLRYNNEQEQSYVPYDYAPFSEWYNFGIYAGNNVPAFGYTQDQVISRDDYDALSPIKRQQALLYGAVRESESKNDDSELTKMNVQDSSYYSDVEVPYEITDTDGVKVKDGYFKAKKDNAECTLTFEGVPGCETYLYFENLQCESKYDAVNIIVSTDTPENRQVTKTIFYKTPLSQFYSGWHNYLVNMCYSDEARTRIKITFTAKGKYSFDALKVICQPMNGFTENAAGLSEETMTDNNLHRNSLSLMTNEITGTISAGQDSYLVLNIPYDKGWRIYVDGEKRTPEKANIMFLGTPISAGTHSIELRYRTPGLTMGILMAIAGIIALIILLVTEKKNAV